MINTKKLEELNACLARIKDPAEKARTLRAVLIAREIGADIPEKIAVVLIHGIRTNAEWQEKIRAEFEDEINISVTPIGYGFLDLFRFWFPFFFRIYPIRRVEQQLRNIAAENRDSKIVVVAHSFGTYIISKIMKRSPDIRIERLLLCGSIISTTWRWDLVPNRPKLILNDVGDKDFLPVIANASSWGYGASGTFGFKTCEAIDRFHNFGHSNFFELNHLKKFWIPFIKDSYVAPSTYEKSRSTKHYFIELLDVLPIKTIILALLLWYFGVISLVNNW